MAVSLLNLGGAFDTWDEETRFYDHRKEHRLWASCGSKDPRRTNSRPIRQAKFHWPPHVLWQYDSYSPVLKFSISVCCSIWTRENICLRNLICVLKIWSLDTNGKIANSWPVGSEYFIFYHLQKHSRDTSCDSRLTLLHLYVVRAQYSTSSCVVP